MHNFLKIGHSDESVVQTISSSEFEAGASKDVTDRLNKFAQTIRAIAPRSQDFLYFSIIFLKAAEVSTIDDGGNIKKIGKENAWGYFDDNWKWHGNVKPHKNNNNDIFPESELKKAARDWIGRPLCVDHKSDSVDGVRGVILDTHYDGKLKQVVGLCALDKVNYPDLARKVQTGVIRYGSMGTAVSTSICSECGNRASTPKQYCDHITRKQAWGEINVGLNPIEYSLVVQPAESGAILLRCFASIQKHDEELKTYGVDTSSLYEKLDDKTANDLDLLLNSVCGIDGCSLDQRQRIVRGYLDTNGFTKTAASTNPKSRKSLEEAVMAVEVATAMSDPQRAQFVKKMLGDNIIEKIASEYGESTKEDVVTSHQTTSSRNGSIPQDNFGVSDFTGAGASSSGLISGVTEDHFDSFNVEGDVIDVDSHTITQTADKDDENLNVKLSSIMEEIMNEARLRKRAALRRKLAYHQGGSDGVEPKTFKSEDYHKFWEDDKQMHQTKSMGGDDGMFPGDEKIKEMQKRAKEKAAQARKIAYHQGGSDGVEPKTFKSENYHKFWEDDKQMHQTKSMGGDDGMFPGDEKVKQLHKRAYTGPALSTRFRPRKFSDGTINKAASSFEVYSGDKLVIAATAYDIFGPKLNENWNWITSKDYAKTVVAQIRENGLEYVGRLLTKTAQAAPPPPPAPPAPPGDMMAAPPAPPGDMGAAPPAPPGDMGAAPSPGGEPGDEGEEKAPKQAVEDALVVMEDNIEKIRDAVNKLSGGEDVDINVNVGKKPGLDVEEGADQEKLALSRNLMKNLKIALAESKDSADELALLSETFDRYKNLNRAQRRELQALTKEAVRDFSGILSQSTSLVRMANSVSNELRKSAQSAKMEHHTNADYALDHDEVEDSELADDNSASYAVDNEAHSADGELVSQALDLRKARRLDILKQARLNLVKTAELEEMSHDMSHMVDDEDMVDDADMGDDESLDDDMMNMDDDELASLDDDMMNMDDDELASLDDDMMNMDDDMGNLGDLDEELASLADDKAPRKKGKKGKNTEEGDVKEAMSKAFLKKQAEEEREAYRIKLRRAYNIAMEMQRKGMIAQSKPALDRQVDSMMEFDDRAFEAFKRSVANFQGTVTNVKVASDVSGLNIGLNQDGEQQSTNSGKIDAKALASLWE